MLLQRDWKAMRGSEWEDYVVEVCRTLGANVQRGESRGIRAGPSSGRGTARRDPPTADDAVRDVQPAPDRGGCCFGDRIPFHAAAVRQVIDELAQKGCDELGIITNARLTAGSKEFARSRRCTLIGEEEFPDFVLGKVAI